MNQINRDIRRAAESAGGRVVELEYELSAADPIGTPPDDEPAWAWCLLKPAGKVFIGSIDELVGSDRTCELLPDAAGRRRFVLRGNKASALLAEDTWRDGDGWHYRFRLGNLPDES